MCVIKRHLFNSFNIQNSHNQECSLTLLHFDLSPFEMNWIKNKFSSYANRLFLDEKKNPKNMLHIQAPILTFLLIYNAENKMINPEDVKL